MTVFAAQFTQAHVFKMQVPAEIVGVGGQERLSDAKIMSTLEWFASCDTQ